MEQLMQVVGVIGGQDGWYYGTSQWGQGEGHLKRWSYHGCQWQWWWWSISENGDTNAEGQGGGGGGYGTAGQNGKWYINENYYGLGGNIVGTENLV